MSFDLSLSAAEAFLPEAPPSNPAFYGSTHARSRDSVRWTPTNHILSTTAHNEIRLLGPSGDIGELKDVSEIRSSEPIYACEPCPILTEYENAVFLYSAREHHIQLRNAYDPEMGLVASYRYTNPTTEAFMSPRSLCFTPDGFHFLAGAKNEIALFDLKDQFNPVSTYVTGGRNRSMHMGGLPTGVRGLVTAIACQEQTFAIGTFERHVGLYDMRSMGPIVNFTLDVPSRQETNGRGVSQIKWSPCGNFLYLAERCSDGICVMDVRSGGQLISWLAGRRAGTMMRLEFDVVPTSDGHEVWAGGVDGKLRVWSNPHRGTGSQTFSSTCQMFEDNGKILPMGCRQH
ncbi:WD40 repeat-like protein [Trichodelitschia bisporula]|uniref:WD40 repeat-like protein n=1 Tax=Trichodelitschia bisporula TaxID=703511 RepID=A0A6G1HZJ4_9PEZI|nr:WD40 repeat-like protein [Trichodelitschia bisporula]